MKLSIITINLNNLQGLKKTIESVKSQIFSGYEFIVIDGGSTDGCIDIIKQNTDVITYWVSEPDSGIYNAMNKGIKRATGDYCYFLNSGDYLYSNNTLSEVFMNSMDTSFICGNFITDKKGVQQIFSDYKGKDWRFSLYSIFSGFVAHQAFFIKKEMFDKYGYYDERLRIMSDWKLFFIAIGIHKETVGYSDTNIVVYDMDGLSSHIGGKIINDEKMIVAKEELPQKVYKQLSRLLYLENNGFIIDFIHSRKWTNTSFKIFFKACKILGLVKS